MSNMTTIGNYFNWSEEVKDSYNLTPDDSHGPKSDWSSGQSLGLLPSGLVFDPLPWYPLK